MDSTIHKFRSAVVGGFNRYDVLHYIEAANAEHRRQLSQLQSQLQEVTEERDQLSKAVDGLQSETGTVAAEQKRVRSSLEESTRSLTTVRLELERTTKELEEARQELSRLQAQVEQYEPMARQYEGLKDRVATVELDAHQKAQATLDQAQAEAQAILRTSQEWLNQVQADYEVLRGELTASADAAAQELLQASRTIQAISERFQAHDDGLRRLTGGDSQSAPKEGEEI